MSIRKISFASGEYYHIYNRGNSKQKIFQGKEDYMHFVGLLYVCNQNGNFKSDNLNKNQGLFSVEINDQIVQIGAYCLMPNHFHILITTNEGNAISKFMLKLTTAYAMYYNKKYKRTGSLFEGKFKVEHASSDRYLKYLFSYIHLNPIKLIDSKWKKKGIRDKSKAIKYLQEYKFSSYLDYLGENRVQNKVLKIEAFPDYFPQYKDLFNEIVEWLSYNDK